MKLKLDENGNAVLQDGKPVYTDEGGKEQAYDLGELHSSIRRLNGEAMERRKENEKLTSSLQAFKKYGDDPEAVAQLVELGRKVKDGKLVENGESEKIRLAAIAEVENKYKPLTKELEDARAALYEERVGSKFGSSEFVRSRVAVPPDMLRAVFGKHFKIEDGNMVAYDSNGHPIYSGSDPSKYASFDEAVERLITTHPHKDRILASTGNAGSGSRGGDGGGAGGRKVSRTEFAAMAPEKQGEFAKLAREGKVSIVD